jgi:predicted acetyltransferase
MSTSPNGMYEIREGRDEDRDSAIELMWKAFDVTGKIEDIKKEEWAQAWSRPELEDWSYVAVEDSKVVSNVSFFSDERNVIRGKTVRFSAVWGVATEPRCRRQGLVQKLFKESFLKMRDEGMSLTVLDPFFKPFYEKIGYALAESRMKHVFKRGDQEDIKGPEDITCRVASSDEDIAIITNLQKAMTRFGSRMFHRENSIKRMIKGKFLHILEKNGKPVGSINFTWRKTNSPYDLHLDAFCLTYTADEVLLSIMELIKHHSANASTISMWCDPQVPVRHFLEDIRNTESMDRGSMMMRVVDFEEYCKNISVPMSASEPIVIAIKDDYCPWNSDTFKVSPDGGRLEVERVAADSEITLSDFQLSQVIGGLSPAVFLHGLGQIPGSASTAIRLEAIFPPDSFLCYQRF